jgi:hypothetical protein
MAIVWTVYGAIDRWNASGTMERKTTPKESFDNPPATTEAAIKALQLQNPTDADAIQAHKTLLRYTKADFKKGIAIIINIAHQFYGPGLSVRNDLDPATLLTNYTNPLEGV